MPSQLTSYAVEVELAGVGGGWTNITADVLLGETPLMLRYGIPRNGPMDRVADVGTASFWLDNSAKNSGGLVGYYSPLNSNVRSGFAFGIGVRIRFTFGGVTYYKWRGTLKDIDPVPGISRERVTRCLAVDWMEQAAEAQIRDVAVQIAKRSDEVFSAVLAKITTQPAASLIYVGIDTFAYALDNLGGDRTVAMSLFQDIALSELGFVYQKGNTTQGGTLVFENRQTRMTVTTNSVTLTNTMVGLEVPRSLEQVFNRVEVVTIPRSIDAAATTVLYSITVPQSTAISGGASVTIWGDYRDPNQTAVWVGGTAMVAPVATTDYTMHANADGTGANLTANFTVTATFFGSVVMLVIANTGATAGFITKLQCRGKGLYRYASQTSRSDNSSSQTTYGLRSITVPMPYQADSAIGQGAADYLTNLYASPLNQVNSVTFEANDSSTLLTAALAREISDRIGVEETVTGVTTTAGGGATRGWYINGVAFEVYPANQGPQIRCTWTLFPSDAAAYWVLDQTGASELNVSTRLAYI